MTMIQLLMGLVHELNLLGAHHAYATRQGADGFAATKHFLVIACKIPAGFHHGTFRCSGYITRP
jgi:hypothetical protein